MAGAEDRHATAPEGLSGDLSGMVPVLAVTDVAEAGAWLRAIAGFRPAGGPERLELGDQRLIVARAEAWPAGFVARGFDHLALRVPDVEDALARALAAGARLHAGFTPDGPRAIAAFWRAGVRFAFVAGPDGAAVEFCERLGEGAVPLGHDHYGLRAADAAVAAAALMAGGAVEIARHRLPGPVEVRFLQDGGHVWEVFDEAAPAGLPALPLGWAGFAPWQASGAARRLP